MPRINQGFRELVTRHRLLWVAAEDKFRSTAAIEDLPEDSMLSLVFLAHLLRLAFGPPLRLEGAPPWPRKVPKFPWQIPTTVKGRQVTPSKGDPDNAATAQISGTSTEFFLSIPKSSHPGKNQEKVDDHVMACGAFLQELWIRLGHWPPGLGDQPIEEWPEPLSTISLQARKKYGKGSWDMILHPLFYQIVKMHNQALVARDCPQHQKGDPPPISAIIPIVAAYGGSGQDGHADMGSTDSSVFCTPAPSVDLLLGAQDSAPAPRTSKRRKPSQADEKAPKAKTAADPSCLSELETSKRLLWMTGAAAAQGGWLGGASQKDLPKHKGTLFYQPTPEAAAALEAAGFQTYKRLQELFAGQMEWEPASGAIAPLIGAHDYAADMSLTFMDPRAGAAWRLHWYPLQGGDAADVVDKRFREIGGQCPPSPPPQRVSAHASRTTFPPLKPGLRSSSTWVENVCNLVSVPWHAPPTLTLPRPASQT